MINTFEELCDDLDGMTKAAMSQRETNQLHMPDIIPLRKLPKMSHHPYGAQYLWPLLLYIHVDWMRNTNQQFKADPTEEALKRIKDFKDPQDIVEDLRTIFGMDVSSESIRTASDDLKKYAEHWIIFYTTRKKYDEEHLSSNYSHGKYVTLRLD